MSYPAILAPLFVQVLLTFVVFVLMFLSRRAALVSKQTRIPDIALGQPNWPPVALARANSFRNQFEMPVLFYVLTILVMMTRHADILFVVLAWIFVLSRVVHAVIHVTSNYVSHRALIYGVGVLVLFVMWIVFAVRILLGLP